MIPAKDLWTVQKIGFPFTSAPMPLADAIAKINGRKGYQIERVRSCLCCGEVGWSNGRCTKHQDRNPCVVDGCKRTRKAHGDLRSDVAICGEHFKAYIRPGSRARRVLNGYYRKAKRLGFERNQRWPRALEERYWTYWHFMLAVVRRRSSEGEAMDEAEIRKMFGWGDD